MDRSPRSRLSRYAIERRASDEHWGRVGLLGTEREASDQIDVAIAMRRGATDDHRIARVGFKRWVAVLGWITVVLMVLVAVGLWVAIATG